MSQKSKLDRISKLKEEELERELELLASKGRKLATNAVVIVGSLALSYFVYKSLFSGKKKGKKPQKKSLDVVLKDNSNQQAIETEQDSWMSQVAHTLAKEAAIVLLTIAKEKIQTYLTTKDEPSQKHTETKTIQ